MTIIKRKNKNLLSIISLLCFFSCANYKSQTEKKSPKCILSTIDKDVILEVRSDILKKQMEDFYNNADHKYDIIFYRVKSGEKDITLRRIYKTSENKWIYIEIINDKNIVQNEMEINDSYLDNLFATFKSKGIYKNCGMCFDCYDYVSLIKKDNEFFSFSFNSLSNNLSDDNLAKLEPYWKILDFFGKYNLSFTK